jgi:hypothetical protein
VILFSLCHVEFPQKTPYPSYADEFVRLKSREFSGWRRDEWAQSPLFIWSKVPPESIAGRPSNPDGMFCGKWLYFKKLDHTDRLW